MAASSANQSGLVDEDLLMAAASGDADSFLALYDRWSARVFGLVLKLVGDAQRAGHRVFTVGVGSAVGPATSTVSAPRRAASAAIRTRSRARC